MKRIIAAFKITIIVSAAWVLTGLLPVSEGSGAAPSDLTRTHSGGGVTVKVTYLNPQGTDGPRFQVVLDTHSVDLDVYDLRELASLRDGGGQTLRPTEVQYKGGGHHRQAILAFPESFAPVKSLELVIRDVAGIKERAFRWDF